MIHSLGDSHAEATFRNIPGVQIHCLGPVTIKRVGYADDNLLSEAVAKLNLTGTDVLILSFGEIDMRCYVQPQLAHRKVSMDDLLHGWADRYLDRVASLPPTGARVVVMSVMPPGPRERVLNPEYPVTGADDERIAYTRCLNGWLRLGCESRGIGYLDVHTLYATPEGALNVALTEDGVHVRENVMVAHLLRQKGWLP